MGCSNSREDTKMHELKIECSGLMLETIEYLTIIEYLLIEQNRISLTLRLISIKKRTEEYYKVISKYRNFWISAAKKELDAKSYKRSIECEREQNKERQQLLKTREVLILVIKQLSPDWQSKFKDLPDLKDSLEQNQRIIQTSTTLYENYYTENREAIKIGALSYSIEMEKSEADQYKWIKSVTVDIYKRPETRVYFTPEIEGKRKEKKHRAEVKESEVVKDEYIAELRSFEEHNRISIGEREVEILEDKNPVIAEDSNTVYSEGDDDEEEEEYIARLSYTQK